MSATFKNAKSNASHDLKNDATVTGLHKNKPQSLQSLQSGAAAQLRPKGGDTMDSTGIPAQMKRQFEETSGFSFDDVRVHYNSEKPGQLQALAYTKGSEVYVAPGQEEHLPHELGHVVQQKRGVVKSTGTQGGLPVNLDGDMERQADMIAGSLIPAHASSVKTSTINAGIVQMAKTQPRYLPGLPGGLTRHHIIPDSLLQRFWDKAKEDADLFDRIRRLSLDSYISYYAQAQILDIGTVDEQAYETEGVSKEDFEMAALLKWDPPSPDMETPPSSLSSSSSSSEAPEFDLDALNAASKGFERNALELAAKLRSNPGIAVQFDAFAKEECTAFCRGAVSFQLGLADIFIKLQDEEIAPNFQNIISHNRSGSAKDAIDGMLQNMFVWNPGNFLVGPEPKDRLLDPKDHLDMQAAVLAEKDIQKTIELQGLILAYCEEGLPPEVIPRLIELLTWHMNPLLLTLPQITMLKRPEPTPKPIVNVEAVKQYWNEEGISPDIVPYLHIPADPLKIPPSDLYFLWDMASAVLDIANSLPKDPGGNVGAREVYFTIRGFAEVLSAKFSPTFAKKKPPIFAKISQALLAIVAKMKNLQTKYMAPPPPSLPSPSPPPPSLPSLPPPPKPETGGGE